MGGGGEQWLTKLPPPLTPAASVVEDMYKVIAGIVLALRSPSGLSMEIRGGGSSDRRQEMRVQEVGPALTLEMTGMERVTPVPKP